MVSGMYVASQPWLARNRFCSFLKTQQRDRLELPLRVLAKHDRIVRLQVAELGRKRDRVHHVVAVLGAARGDDPQVLVIELFNSTWLVMRFA